MNVFELQVCHRQYGIGTVIEQNDTMIEVQFNNEYGKKKFLYPSAFESFLSLSNSIHQGEMNEELKLIQDKKESDRKQKEEEAKRRTENERKAILEQKRSSIKKRTKSKPEEFKPILDDRYEQEPMDDEDKLNEEY